MTLKMVEHHTHYVEIDGYDASIFITESEHKSIDHRLLFPNVTVRELREISNAAYRRGHRDDLNERRKGKYKESIKTYQDAHKEEHATRQRAYVKRQKEM